MIIKTSYYDDIKDFHRAGPFRDPRGLSRSELSVWPSGQVKYIRRYRWKNINGTRTPSYNTWTTSPGIVTTFQQNNYRYFSISTTSIRSREDILNLFQMATVRGGGLSSFV
ncbi:15305_t:CDS:2 [Funneliformis geosporum]|nr:15305_t:CDS:2 [Funneliformis geosporum]